MCWNKGRLRWKIAKLFYFCHLKKLVRPETFGTYCIYIQFLPYRRHILCNSQMTTRWKQIFCSEHHTKCENAEFLALQQLVHIITIRILKVNYTVLTDLTIWSSNPGRGMWFFSAPKHQEQLLGFNQPRIQWLPRLFPGVKRPGRETDHSGLVQRF